MTLSYTLSLVRNISAQIDSAIYLRIKVDENLVGCHQINNMAAKLSRTNVVCDIVKHELQATSCELRVASYDLEA